MLHPSPTLTRRQLLDTLRQRFTTQNLRSRSLRLNRCTLSAAFDLSALQEAAPDAFAALLDRLGADPPQTVPLLPTQPTDPRARALADMLTPLAHAAQDTWQETGRAELAVGWPFLEGHLDADTWIRAPLLLFPASLEATTQGLMQWQLRLTALPTLNAALAAALRRFLGISLWDASMLAADEDGLLRPDAGTWRDLHALFARLGVSLLSPPALPPLTPFAHRDKAARAAQPSRGLRLESAMVLGRFPPASTSLLSDYDALLDTRLSDQDLGRAADLLDVDQPARPTSTQPGPPRAAERPPAARAPLGGARQHAALDSDSSQDAVLAWLDAAAEGRDDASDGLLVQGPPGTGKSQLIANLLTAAIARDMRALVVCEKRAALDVVAQRLAALGLGDALALVHDVAADRDAVGASIAATLGPMSAPTLDAPDDIAAVAAHEAALQRASARLVMADAAFHTLTGPRPRHRPLCALQAQALDDPGHPLPDLSPFAQGASEDDLEARAARLDALGIESAPLATPHPLSIRGDWSAHGPEALEVRRAALALALDAAQAVTATRGGHLRPAQAAQREPLWRSADATLALLTEPDRAPALHRALLFWAFTGGDLASGPLQTVTRRLLAAQQSLRFAPPELILEPEALLRAWIASLDALERLQGLWWRGLSPKFWRLRRLPGEVLDRCPSLYEARASMGGLPVNVRRLCEAALGWQALIADLPHDHPLLCFGFQGDPQEVTDALASLEAQQASARQIQGALQALQGALRGAGPSYATLPDLTDLSFDAQADPFLRAAAADRLRATRFAALTAQVEAAASVWGGQVPGLLRALRDAVGQAPPEGGAGDLAQVAAARRPLEAALAAWADAPKAAALDRLLAAEPAWTRALLRGWRPSHEGARAGDDARWALARAWRAAAMGGEPRRALEAPLTEPALLDALDADMTACQQAAARATGARWRQRVAAALNRDKARGKDLRQLAAAAGRRRKRLSLRQLIEGWWERGLAQVRPVWLCSPDAVASLFPLKPGLFDLVIFDEASQCPVECAPTVALRARRVLIAGDAQQMPPSQMFQASGGVVAPPEVADSAALTSPSLLALAGVAYPSMTLRWHYRSRHESLIAFSNAAFYGGQLVTAPRAARAVAPNVEGLHWRLVEGAWDDQRNHPEAQAVVDVIARLLCAATPDGPPPTLGVVTFNLAQADLIYALIQARAAADDAFRAALARDRARPAIEQLFVRNLENVQGDERDVILFSPAYAPATPGGPVAARFGPLNQAGGEKRLNVAITRARLGVWVVASFDPNQLNTDATLHPGPKLLHLYLRYVQAANAGRWRDAAAALRAAADIGGGGAQGGGAQAPRWSSLGWRVRDEVARALEAHGLHVETSYGVGRQRLDLVFGPSPDDWRAAVDTSAFLCEPDTLTRDLYQRRYWRRLGWRVHRVTPGQWLDERSVAQALLEMG